MYRVSPFTYWVAGIASTMLAGRQVQCAQAELSIFPPPAGQTCEQYLGPYAAQAGGTIQNPASTTECQYCSLSVADQFLAGSNIYYSERWRNFGLMWVFVVFQIFVAVFAYWFFRVRQKKKGPGLAERVAGSFKWIVTKFWKKQH